MKLKWEVYIEEKLIGETKEFDGLSEAAELYISEERIGLVRKYIEENNWRPVVNSIHYKLVKVA